jgi:hypothetical protein
MTEKEIVAKWKAEDMAKAAVLDNLLQFEEFQKAAPDLYLTLKELILESCLKILPPEKILH